MIFLPHTSTVILLEPYCGTITEPGLPVRKQDVFDAVENQAKKSLESLSQKKDEVEKLKLC